MRLVLFSDLHLDSSFTWAGADLARKRRQAIRDSLRRIIEVADEVSADAIVCAGDLYEHERYAPDTGAFLRDQFGSAGRPVLVAPGNHDWLGPASLYAQVEWPESVHIFSTDRLTPCELTPGFTIWGAAHLAPANTDPFLDGFQVDRGGLNLGLFHGSEQGGFGFQESGKVAHAPFRAADVPRVGLAHALVGHFHTPADAEWHTYPGNPEPLTFGETGERGVVIVDIGDDGSITRTRRVVRGTEVSDVAVDISGVAHRDDIRARVREALGSSSGVVRVTLEGDVDPSIDVRPDGLDDVAPHLQGLVVRMGAVHAAYDLEAIAAEPGVRGRFVLDVQASDLTDDEKRRVIVTGLRALDGRTGELEVY